MNTNNKNIKIILFVVTLLLIVSMPLIKYDIYSYMYEYEERFKLYQEQLDSYEKSANEYKGELLDIKNELSDTKKELEGVKKELSDTKKYIEDVKKDIDNLKNKIKNAPSSNDGLPDTNNNGEYMGRLYIPSVNINVALYKGWAQYITDRNDSANYFSLDIYSNDNMIIADHNNQEFSKLFKVEVGTTGYIEFKDGSVKNIKCVEILSGYNKKEDLTDKNNNSVTKREDYLMYTCQNGWRNILICLWTVV